MTMLKNKKFNAALLGAAGVIALCTQQAFAFGGMGGAMAGGLGGGRIGGIGAGRIGSIGSRGGALSVGTMTVNGISVLPNGTVVVPAVTPRGPNAGSELNQLNSPPVTAPCSAGIYCSP
jgi:hypothetical protein